MLQGSPGGECRPAWGYCTADVSPRTRSASPGTRTGSARRGGRALWWAVLCLLGVAALPKGALHWPQLWTSSSPAAAAIAGVLALGSLARPSDCDSLMGLSG